MVEDLDRVEAAFIKLDTDGDGFVDWEEFKHVTKHCDTEEARRVMMMMIYFQFIMNYKIHS